MQFLRDFIPAAAMEPRPLDRTLSVPVPPTDLHAVGRANSLTRHAQAVLTPPNSAPATSPDPAGPQPTVPVAASAAGAV